jgi:hypothetical protein
MERFAQLRFRRKFLAGLPVASRNPGSKLFRHLFAQGGTRQRIEAVQ